MATLVLTTIGTAIGGPIGGALGAILGSTVDRGLLAPSRKGPRLGDLSVQTSSYGSAIPRLYGTLRVAGTVIWATDLREDRHKSGGGKGGAKTTTYSYSACFAVALSGRPIRRVGRIWADGKLLRGAAGDWKSETGFRLYLGGEDQPVDPLIAAAEGIAATPAHRGIAYAVFDTMQLADFGNRIPSLTFEVIADEMPVPVGAIAADLSGGAIRAGGGDAPGGYAASGDSARPAIEVLAQCWPLPLADDGAALAADTAAPVALAPDELGTGTGATAAARRIHTRAAGDSLPDEVSIGYYEPGRDYQAGLQRARRDGIGARAERVELPAAVSADVAKGLAEGVLARRWAARDQATASLPWRRLPLRAGTAVTLDAAIWRVRGWSLEHMVLTLRLEQERAAPAVPAAGGRATTAEDAAAGTTVPVLLDLPAMGDGAADAPQMWLAAAGTAPGWRRAETSLTLDGGASWQAIGRTAAPAIIGSAIGALAAGPRELTDLSASVEIALLHDGMALASADRDQLVAGGNLAMLGDELLQFGDAVQIGPARWRLGRLLRGRRGTETAIGGHVAGERFVLIEPATLLPLPVPLTAIGATATVMAIGPGDAGIAATASAPGAGRAVRPPAPVRFTATPLADGTIRFGWIRRSRAGWTWLDGADVPLGEDAERYRLTLTPAAGAPRTVEVAIATWDYSPDARAADGANGTLAASVRQIGTRGLSPAATLAFDL